MLISRKLIVLIVTSLFFSGIYSFLVWKPVKSSTPIVIDNTVRKISVHGDTPSIKQELKPIKLEKEKWIEKQVLDLFKNDGRFEKNTHSSVPDQEIEYQNKENHLSTLKVSPAGIYYYREHVDKPVRMSRDKALEVAIEFIKSHGGMPKDAELLYGSSTSTVKLDFYDSSKEVPTIITHDFYFRHKHKGYEIANDRIDLEVTDEGIVSYVRDWRDVAGELDDMRNVPYMQVAGALQKLGNMEKTGYKLGKKDPLKIIRTSIAYASRGVFSDIEIAYPTYQFDLYKKGSLPPQSVYVDGRTGIRMVDWLK